MTWVIASQPYRARRASLDFKAKKGDRAAGEIARDRAGRLIAIHSHGQRSRHGRSSARCGPGDNPFVHDRHQIMKAV